MMRKADTSKLKFGALAAAALTGGILVAVVLGGFDGSASAVRLPAVADKMRAFDDPPVPSADIPEVVRQAQENLGRAGHGTAMPGQVRRLAAGLGRNGVGIYAFPTTGGAVCVVVSEKTYAATCVDSFTRDAANVRPLIYSGVGAPVTIAGLATNDVRGVQVVVKGVAHDAVLRGNAFYWQSNDPAVARDDVTGLRVRQMAGDVLRYDLDFGD